MESCIDHAPSMRDGCGAGTQPCRPYKLSHGRRGLTTLGRDAAITSPGLTGPWWSFGITNSRASMYGMIGMDSVHQHKRRRNDECERHAQSGLAGWGWDDGWTQVVAALWGAGEPRRVSSRHRNRWKIQTSHGPRHAGAVPRSPAPLLPSVGDRVLASRGSGEGDVWLIDCLLPRRSCLSPGSVCHGSESTWPRISIGSTGSTPPSILTESSATSPWSVRVARPRRSC